MDAILDAILVAGESDIAGGGRWPLFERPPALTISSDETEKPASRHRCPRAVEVMWMIRDYGRLGQRSQSLVFLSAYSYRSATIGSTRVARRAGTQHATSVTAVSNAAITTNVNGSKELMPNSSPR